jgi:T5SS/PEP-CTERM-associated repeat protein
MRLKVLFFLFVTLTLGGVPRAHSEKIWTNVVSGFWQDGTNWTGHTPPDITSFIRITNDNAKTVTINALTPASTLTVQVLTLSAPPGATNTLLVKDAGTNNPLTFQTGLELQEGAALRITNSALLVQLTNDHVNIDGSMTLDSGYIDFGDITVTARVGRATSGVLTIHSGGVSAGTMTVGGLTNSTGFLNMDGGQLLVSSLMSIGRNPSTIGTAMILGGHLSVPNDDTRIGDEGGGVLVISNATATVTNLQVGRDPAATGSLTLQQGGVIQVQSDVQVGRFNGSTGLVSVAGGRLLASGFTIYVGRGGNGQLTLSNGTVTAARLLVAADKTNSVGGTGLLSANGGVLLVSSNLMVGSASFSSGQAVLNGGTVVVTNAQGTAVSTISSGALGINSGSLISDNLQLTNTSGQLTFKGGTLDSKNTTVANGSAFVIGDGIHPANFHLSGGTHAFANGLVISSNATLDGCGTIIGAIVNHGTILTNCGGTTVVPPAIATQPTGQVVTQNGTLSLSVSATGTAPLSYQWMHGSGILTGATSSAYVKTNVQPADAGDYAVIITNAAGAVTSAVAVVTVLVPPSISVPPQNETVVVGGTASFSVTATGTQPMTYQWQFGSTDIAGATTSAYVKTNVQPVDVGTYTVVITNIAGAVRSSANLQVEAGVTVSFVSRAGSTNTLSVQSLTGSTYTLEFKDSLSQTNWKQVLPSTAGTGGLIILQDPASPGSARFYRVASF